MQVKYCESFTPKTFFFTFPLSCSGAQRLSFQESGILCATVSFEQLEQLDYCLEFQRTQDLFAEQNRRVTARSP